MTTSIWAWLTAADSWRGPDGIPTRLQEHLSITALVLLIACMVLFVVAEDVGTLLAARALQGTGAAIASPTGRAKYVAEWTDSTRLASP